MEAPLTCHCYANCVVCSWNSADGVGTIGWAGALPLRRGGGCGAGARGCRGAAAW